MCVPTECCIASNIRIEVGFLVLSRAYRHLIGEMLYLLLTVILLTSAAAEEPKQQPPIRAKEPTVVTVEGKRSPVELDEEGRPKDNANPFTKAIKGIGRGAAKVGTGVVDWVGHSLGVHDDIPADRERTQEPKPKQLR